MSARDRRLAEKYAAQGKKSATETSREREASRGRGRSSTPASGDVIDALRNFDPKRPSETRVPRSEESRERARSFKERLPKLR
jgi:hypothetical protein